MLRSLSTGQEGTQVMKILGFSAPVLLKCIALIAVLVVFACPLFGKRKDDVVIMKNGDTFTGEIKGLQHGELIFKSDYMKDSVHLDWAQVQTLQSKDIYIVGLSNGERLTGMINKPATPRDRTKNVRVVAEESTVEVKPLEVIAIEQREGSFWNQLTGSINYGFSFASGSNSTNSSLGADAALDTAKNSVQLASSSQFDSQANSKNTNRLTFDSRYGRSLTNKWIAAGLFGLLKSNQQDLKLRSTYGGGFGRRLLRTDKTSLIAIAGAAYSHESYVPQPGAEQVHDNAESLIGITFSTFRFKTLNLNSRTLLFPSLSDPGRQRLSSQSNLRIELARNFYWNFQLYENYDTRPPVNDAKNDLGVTTSVGWTF